MQKPIFPHKQKKDERGVSLEKLVAIIDGMPEYGTRLATYLNSSRTFPYRAVVFSATAEIESYVKNDGVYAVIAAETLEKEVLAAVAGTRARVFCLEETKDNRGRSSLYRYMSAKEIEGRLTEIKTMQSKIPVIGFFSPAGGYEAEGLSRKIAEGIGRKGRVLYVPLFPFGVYGRDAGDGLSEALYYMRQGTEESRSRLQGVLERGAGMDCIRPARWYTDLWNITKEDMEGLFRGNVWATEYRAFFVAVDRFDQTGRAVLNCCDKVLMPVWETADGLNIAEEFRRQLKESGETGVYSGLIDVRIPKTGDDAFEAAVEEAVKKGGEAIEGSGGGDSQAYA